MKYFSADGKLVRIERYVKGIPEGEWNFFEKDHLIKTEVYKNGELISIILDGPKVNSVTDPN